MKCDSWHASKDFRHAWTRPSACPSLPGRAVMLARSWVSDLIESSHFLEHVLILVLAHRMHPRPFGHEGPRAAWSQRGRPDIMFTERAEDTLISEVPANIWIEIMKPLAGNFIFAKWPLNLDPWHRMHLTYGMGRSISEPCERLIALRNRPTILPTNEGRQ